MKTLYAVMTLGLVVILGFFSFAFAQEKLLPTLEQQIDPKITALLIIDMQNDYVADDGKVGKLGMEVKKIQAVVPMMNKLIEEARAPIKQASTAGPEMTLPFLFGNLP